MGGFPGEKKRSLIFVELRNIPANKAGVEMGAGVGAGAAAAAPGAGALTGVGVGATAAASGTGPFTGAGAAAAAGVGLGVVLVELGLVLEDDMVPRTYSGLNCRRGEPKLVGEQNSPGYRGHVETPKRDEARARSGSIGCSSHRTRLGKICYWTNILYRQTCHPIG